jgi:hypothetical protein
MEYNLIFYSTLRLPLRIFGSYIGDRVERQRILNELDSALALGLSEKEARLHLMRDKIAPFDVVEEYNRSIENWIFRYALSRIAKTRIICHPCICLLSDHTRQSL